LEEILKKEDYVENLIAVTPGLGQDVLALGEGALHFSV